MNRREMILSTATAAFGLSLTGFAADESARPKKVLFFSKSSGFEHSAIKVSPGKPGLAQGILAELGPKHGIEFTFSKDGSLFTPEYLDQFDAYSFYTTGVLTMAGTDKNPPMTPEGKAAFLHAIENGKGFVGMHSATDTFHVGEGPDMPAEKAPTRYKNYGADADPYIRMIGGEFIHHDKQQVAKMRVVDQKFPGFEKAGDSFSLNEEWYSLKDFSDNLHVLLVQETEGMVGSDYQRPSYPATWARMHGKGRVFYTSMGHRDDVWANPLFQNILFGGMAWAIRNVDADVTPNLLQAAPGCMTLPAPPKPKAG